MKKTFDLKNALIIILLLTLILFPRPLTGALELRSAYHQEEAGSFREAADAYASAAARLPWMPALWSRAGEMAFAAGNSEDSILFLKKAASGGVITKLGWLDLGRMYQQQGDMPSARNAWENALPLADAYRSLAQAQQSAGNFPAAIEDWRASISQEPKSANSHYHLGLLLAATDADQALPELMLAAQLDPSLEKSVQDMRTALNTAFLSENRAYQFLVAGQALASLGEWDLAGKAFANAINIDESYAEAWAWLGLAKQQQGQDGSDEFSKAMTLNPKKAIIQGLYGIYLQKNGKSDAALKSFLKAADLEPVNPGWQIALGSAYEQIGDLISAYSHYSRAVELAPRDPSAWQALATFCVNNNLDVDVTGLPAAHMLIELAPDNWQSYDLAGQAAFLLNDYSVSEDFLKKAIQLAPTQAAPALHLGQVYLQLGKPALAYSYLSLAKTFDPSGPYGWQAGRLLEQVSP